MKTIKAETLLIEDGIPIPTKRSGRPKGSVEPKLAALAHVMRGMKSGQSFHVECPAADRNGMQMKLSTHARISHVQYTTRQDEAGVRFWRK